MANLGKRFGQMLEILNGGEDLEALRKALEDAQKEVGALKKELSLMTTKVSRMEQDLQSANETVEKANELVKKQSTLYVERMEASAAKEKNLLQQIKSMSRKPVNVDGNNQNDPTKTLEDMLEELGKDSRNVLNPDEVKKLLSSKDMKFSASCNITMGENKYTGYTTLDDALVRFCVDRADASWTKPVLTSLFQAIGEKNRKERLINTIVKEGLPDRLVFDDRSLKKNLDRIRLLDIACGIAVQEGFHIDDFRQTYADASPSKDPSIIEFCLLRKHGFPVEEEFETTSLKKYADERLNDIKEQSRPLYKKFMLAKTPEDLEMAESRFGDALKLYSDIYQVLTGQPLWPDKQKTQKNSQAANKAAAQKGPEY